MAVVNYEMTKQYPELGTGPVSVEPYVSPEYFEKEREKIFARSWLNVGRDDQIPNAGDFFVREIEVMKASIILVRSKDKVVRAFHNVCTHKGNRVCIDENGNTKGFQCCFHGWVFDTSGSLVSIPGQELFYNLDKAKLGLREVSCDVWNGFIFINLQATPDISLQEYLGPEFLHRFDDYPFDELQLQQSHRVRVKCNYKIFIDAFQEGLHVSHVHRRSLPDTLTSAETPIVHQEMEVYERHRMAAVTFNPGATVSPMMEAMGRNLGASYLFRDPAKQPKGLNFKNDPHWIFDINVFHPNWRFVAYQDSYLYETYWPISVNETIWDLSFYCRPPQTAGQKIFSQVQAGMIDVLREDLSTLERTQAALESGVLKEIQLSDEELLCRHMHKVVEDAVKA